MSTLSLADLANLENEATAVAAINSNNAAIEAAIADTVTKSGPNAMSSNLDMNSHFITNLPAAVNPGDAVRKAEFDSVNGVVVDAALVLSYKVAAAASATSASASATSASGSATAAAASAAAANAIVVGGLNWTTLTGKPTFATVATSGLYTDLSSRPTLGTAAALDTGTTAGKVVVLDGSAKLPAVDGSQLTGLTALPAGALMPYAGSSAPAGFLLCGGQAVSRATYSALFAIVSTTYGVGDGSTTFNLPDLRGRSVFGKDDMNGSAANRVTNAATSIVGTTLGASGGAETHTLTTAQLPAHNHDPILIGAGNGTTNVYANFASTPFSVSSVSGSGNMASVGSNAAHNNMPPAFILNYIIKT